MKEDETKHPTWEAADPKPPVIHSGPVLPKGIINAVQ